MCPVFPLQDEKKKKIFFFQGMGSCDGILQWFSAGLTLDRSPWLLGLAWRRAPDALGNIWDDEVYTT